MSAENDGGPAFPQPHEALPDGSGAAFFPLGFANQKPGMSLRDYFAAAPMSDVELETLREAFSKRFPAEPLSISRLRYWRADTMLEARAQCYAEHQTPTPLKEPVVIPAQPGEDET